mmetsp:Transcript_3852/g.17597  ORF Transcript_3852/g.17597 Transcript_3852/m.17597 type:complete len:364 (-) Transcript_3852:304-1395(-)
MIAVAARTPAPIKTVRWASSCEALILDTGAVEREELCDSPSSIRLEATQQLREARAFVHRQAATSLCERGLRAAELAEEHGRLKDAELILGAIVAQLRRRMATQEIATWMDRQRRRLATVDAEIERKTEEHRRRRAAEMAALNAKGGPRMLEMPVLVRTPSLEELQADDDELDVPAEAATVVPGTPPGMAQLLTRISSQHNDENVAPSDEDTPAATACDVTDTTSPEREEEDDAKAGGEDAKAEDERADVTPADASFDQPTQLAADAPDEVALMARACYAQSRVHTLRGRWEEADSAREMGSVYARMCAAPAEAVPEKNFREEGNDSPQCGKRARETDAVETTGKAAKVSDGTSGWVEVAAEA